MNKIALALLLVLTGCQTAKTTSQDLANDSLKFPGEKHLKNIKQLTFGGQNAEAYFSKDGQWISFQSQRGGHPCDEQYVMKIDGSQLRKVSTGNGRVTCGYLIGEEFNGDPTHVIFASTHDFGAACPAKMDPKLGYVWPIYDSYEIYKDKFSGGKLERLTRNKFYDAEATVSPDQKQMVFTSTRDGDLDLYIMDVNGKSVKRITSDVGYDGGAFFSHDGKKLIYRAFHPKTPAEVKSYTENLKKGMYKPSWLELFIVDVDGNNKKQITELKGGSFAPYLFPNDNRVIFSTNFQDPTGRKFDLFAVDIDGKNLEQITYSGTFDAFPMFSPDGKKIVWASNRNGKVPHETNLFIADWID